MKGKCFMKKKRMLAMILAATICLGTGNTAWSAEFQDEGEAVEVFSSTEGQSVPSEETFSDGISEQIETPFTEEPENQEMFSSGSEAEEGTEGLVYEYSEESDSYTVVKGINKDSVYIPAAYEGKPVMEIAAGAFKDFDAMQRVFLAQPGATIHTGAFQNCSSLIYVGIEGSINIESRAFTDCPKLYSMSWLDCVEQVPCTIAPDAFDMDSKVILWSYGRIDDEGESFQALDMESYFEFDEDGVTYIEAWQIDDQPNDIGSIVTNFNNSCSILTLWSDGLEPGIIYRKAFYGCDKLEELTINPEMQSIQTKAFANCTNLRKVYIPSSVKEIADDAFSGCTKVTITGMPGSYAQTYAQAHSIPFKAAVSAPSITNITINKNMATIELSDFYGDMYYCVAGTVKRNNEPVRRKNGRIAINQTGNKVVFRNLSKGTYYIGARALSFEGTKKTYSGWSNIIRVSIQADTPARPEISSVNVSGRNIRLNASLPKGAFGYDVMLSRGTKKNDSSTVGVSIPASAGAVYKQTNVTGENLTIPNIKPGTYYLGIQAYSIQEGQKIYSQWSPLKKITIK